MVMLAEVVEGCVAMVTLMKRREGNVKLIDFAEIKVTEEPVSYV